MLGSKGLRLNFISTGYSDAKPLELSENILFCKDFVAIDGCMKYY